MLGACAEIFSVYKMTKSGPRRLLDYQENVTRCLLKTIYSKYVRHRNRQKYVDCLKQEDNNDVHLFSKKKVIRVKSSDI